MMYFGNRKPRGFHHTFMFVDERKELIRRLEAGIDGKDDAARDTGKARPALGQGAFRAGGRHSFLPVTVGFGLVVLAVALLIITLCVLMNL